MEDSSTKLSIMTTVSDIKEESTISLKGTVTTRTKLRKWSRHKSSGTMITGILADNTGCIDFVLWTEAADKYDNILKENATYTFNLVKAVTAKGAYSKSKHNYQVVIDTDTEIQNIDQAPFIPPLEITSIANLSDKQNSQTFNIVGKVISIPAKEKLPNSDTDIVKVKIQDNTASIQLSLIGKEIQQCNFAVGDIILLEKIELRIYGPLRVLHGSTGVRYVNPTNRDLKQYQPTDNTPTVDLSPPKGKPMLKDVKGLNKSDGRQVFTSTIHELNIKDCLYDRCPKINCRSRIIQMNNGLFKCNNCDTDYISKATGVRLIIRVGINKDDQKKILMFNETAESFLEKNVQELENMSEDNLEELAKNILSKTYTFTVGARKSDNEFLCETCITVNDDMKYPQPSTSQMHASKTIMPLQSEVSTDEVKCPTQLDMNSNVQSTPLDLSFTPEDQPQYNITLPRSPCHEEHEIESVDTSTSPLDLSQPPQKKYRFVRRQLNFPDFNE